MRLTCRDHELLRDMAFSHALSRDQMIALGYFQSITRVNTRIRQLAGIGLVRRLDTPFFSQSLYGVAPKAAELLDARLSRLIAARDASPRFLRHALTATDVRIALTRRSNAAWRFEQQLWRKVDEYEVRPDGLLEAAIPVFIEIDLGHVSLPKFKSKLLGYRALALSGQCASLYGFSDFRLLAVTTGRLRSRHLSRQMPADPGFEFLVQTYAELGLAPTNPWS